MSENNAVTKEELKEILAEMAKGFHKGLEKMSQEFRGDLAVTNQNVAALDSKVDTLTGMNEGFQRDLAETNQNVAVLARKVDANEQKLDRLSEKVDNNEHKLETFRVEVMARFDVADEKHSNLVKAIFALREGMDAQFQELRESQSKILTGMDPVMREHEIIRHEQISLGVIQDRHTRDIESLKKHVGLERSNDNHNTNRKGKKPGLGRKKKSK